MAVKTPDTIYEESMGSCKLIIASFSSTNIDTGDTWASGLSTSPKYYWWQTNAATSTASVNVSVSSGTFTFSSAADNHNGFLFVMV